MLARSCVGSTQYFLFVELGSSSTQYWSRVKNKGCHWKGPSRTILYLFREHRQRYVCCSRISQLKGCFISWLWLVFVADLRCSGHNQPICTCPPPCRASGRAVLASEAMMRRPMRPCPSAGTLHAIDRFTKLDAYRHDLDFLFESVCTQAG
jgi:hypothetical protein